MHIHCNLTSFFLTMSSIRIGVLGLCGLLSWSESVAKNAFWAAGVRTSALVLLFWSSCSRACWGEEEEECLGHAEGRKKRSSRGMLRGLVHSKAGYVPTAWMTCTSLNIPNCLQLTASPFCFRLSTARVSWNLRACSWAFSNSAAICVSFWLAALSRSNIVCLQPHNYVSYAFVSYVEYMCAPHITCLCTCCLQTCALLNFHKVKIKHFVHYMIFMH